MPPEISDEIRVLAAETLAACSDDWSASAKADEVLRRVYPLIFAAGVAACREKIEGLDRYEAYTHYESGYATGGDSRPAPDGEFVRRDAALSALDTDKEARK